jgi:hypothetical protein
MGIQQVGGGGGGRGGCFFSSFVFIDKLMPGGIICFWHAFQQHLNYYTITSSVRERTVHEIVRMFRCTAMFLSGLKKMTDAGFSHSVLYLALHQASGLRCSELQDDL